jgi:hypothetical protein
MNSREQFEQWATEEAEKRNYAHMKHLLTRHPVTGEYNTTWVDSAWMGWQASRAAIVIELPKRADTGVDTGGWPIDSGSHRINCVLAQCAMAIGAAGLRVRQP